MGLLFFYFPFFFLPVVLKELILHPASIYPETSIWHFIANTVFLNSLHVPISFLLIAKLGSFQKALVEIPNQRIFFIKIFLIFMFFSLFSYLGSKLSIYVFFTILHLFYSKFHSLKQSFGFCRLMDRQFKKHISIDRFGFNALILMFSTHAFMILKKTDFLFIKSFLFFLFVAEFLIVLSLISQAYLSGNKLKALYLCRLIFIPLSVYSFKAMMITLAYHGVENVIFFKKLLKTQKPNYHKTLTPFFCVLSIFTFAILLTGIQSGIPSLFKADKASNPLQHFFTSYFYGASVTHFYLEGVFYNMKSNISRKHLGLPLDNSFSEITQSYYTLNLLLFDKFKKIKSKLLAN